MEKAREKKLKCLESDYFVDGAGVRVGITWSEEHDNRWFLNLLENKFDEAVLLCQTKSDESLAVRLPKAFINRHWHHFSRDGIGEIKFVVMRERGSFYVQLVQPVGKVDVSEYVEKDRVVASEWEYA